MAKHSLFRAIGVTSELDRSAGESVLLTFDDGPHPETTPRVLDCLADYGARAVFFVVGNRVPLAPWVLGEIVARGHLIGNHTFAHSANQKARQYTDEIQRCQDVVQQLTGTSPVLFRPPQGKVSVAGVLAARRLGLKTVHWSASNSDWALRDHGSAVTCGEQLRQVVGPRDIVLLHDEQPWVLTVLDILLPHLASQGIDLRRGVDSL
jgi:peptidoglycan/xylan/chitin deacetylase (PgdA/CDA1 family)